MKSDDALKTAYSCWWTIMKERHFGPHWQFRGHEENRLALRLYAVARGNGWAAMKAKVWP